MLVWTNTISISPFTFPFPLVYPTRHPPHLNGKEHLKVQWYIKLVLYLNHLKELFLSNNYTLLFFTSLYYWKIDVPGGGGDSHTSLIPTRVHQPLKWPPNGVVQTITINGVVQNITINGVFYLLWCLELWYPKKNACNSLLRCTLNCDGKWKTPLFKEQNRRRQSRRMSEKHTLSTFVFYFFGHGCVASHVATPPPPRDTHAQIHM